MARLTEEQFIKRLRKACAEAGTQKAFAKRHNLPPQIISDILLRCPGRTISDTVARTLNCSRKRIVVFEELS